jgi:hypothetical protein
MSRLISFPQAFALNKGANYPINANFTGLPIATLRAAGGFKFNQPAFQTPAANLYNSATTTYALGNSTTTASAGLVYKFGGNLVDTAIKWTNGKSLGTWYKLLRHGNVSTGGTVASNGKILKITSGLKTSYAAELNRALIHDTKFQRTGVEITENSGTVTGWLMPQDKVNTTLYFKGYVEKESLSENGVLNEDLMIQKTFRVGYWFAHSVQNYDPTLNVCWGSSHGFGFTPSFTSGTYTWKCIIIGDSSATGQIELFFVGPTGLSAFSPQELKVTFNNGVVSWFAGNMVTPIQTVTLSSFPDYVLHTGTNALYGCVVSIALSQDPGGIPFKVGAGTICVQEAATWREYPGDGRLGVSATLSGTGTNVVSLANTSGIVPGMRITRLAGPGNFNNAAQTTGNGIFVGAVTLNTSFTVVDHFGNSVNHSTAGAITFDVGKGLFAFNNFEDTNTEVTDSDTAYHTTGLQLLKKLK